MMNPIHAGACLAIVLLAACAPGGRGTAGGGPASPSPNEPASSETTSQRGASAIPAPSNVRARNLILPLEDFPLSGYALATDDGDDNSWRRLLDPTDPTTARYLHVLLQVNVEKLDDAGMRTYVNSISCDATAERGGAVDGQGPTSAGVISVPATGDNAHGCVYMYANGVVHYEYTASRRMTFVFVQDAPAPSVSQTEAVNLLVEISRREVAMLDRMAAP